MERRDWSVEALNELIYVDSLESYEKADALVRWHEKYLSENTIQDFDLEFSDLKKLEELFFKNLSFLKTHKETTQKELVKMQKLRKFLDH